jgi:hypothetical protein
MYISHPHAVSLWLSASSAYNILLTDAYFIYCEASPRAASHSPFIQNTLLFIYVPIQRVISLDRAQRDTNILYKAAEIRRIGHCIVLHEKRLAPLLLAWRMINIFCFMISLVSLPTCLLLRAETQN